MECGRGASGEGEDWKRSRGGLRWAPEGLSRVRRAEFGWGKGRFGLGGGLPCSRAHLLRSSRLPGSAWKWGGAAFS